MSAHTRLAIALFATAIAVRPHAVSFGPILPDVQHDLGMSHATSGLIGMVPVICLGLFAPLGVRLAARIRPRPALGVALGIVLVFGAARALATDVTWLLAATIGLGIGMGLAGSLPSMIVKGRAPGHPGLMTSMHGMGVVAGASLGAFLILPLTAGADGWRPATLLLSLPVAAIVAAGFVMLGPDPGDVRPRGGAQLPWGDRDAWMMAGIFAFQSLVYWGLVVWLAEVLVGIGWSIAAAGNLVASLQLAGVVAVVFTGYAADRFGSRKAQLLAVSGGFTVILVALAAAPGLALVWVPLLGLCLGAAFPLCLMLPVDYADDDRDAGNKASLMLLIGYLFAALGPSALGLVREWTTASAPVFLLLAAAGVGFLVLTSRLGPPHRPRDIEVVITAD